MDFEPDRHLTLRLEMPWAIRLFGELAMTYAVSSFDDRRTRLVAKLVLAEPAGLREQTRERLLAWGDLVIIGDSC